VYGGKRRHAAQIQVKVEAQTIVDVSMALSGPADPQATPATALHALPYSVNRAPSVETLGSGVERGSKGWPYHSTLFA
jgi:hypothetical protein